MSYILDALRKADAQRSRDPVRGIHAQPLRGSLRGDTEGAGKAGLVAAVAAAIAVVGGAAWYVFHDRDRTVVAPQATPVAQAPVVAPPVIRSAPPPPVVAQQPAPPPVVGSAIQPPPPGPTLSREIIAMVPAGPPPGVDPRNTPRPMARGAAGPMPGAVAQGPSMPAPQPSLPAAPQAVTPPAPAAPGPSMAPPPSPGGAPVIAAPAMVAPLPAVPSQPQAANIATPPVAGLPPDAPRLAISGGVYSSNRAQRMLIVNGNVFNEGSEIASGVVLEEVKAKTAVLRFRGARYTVGY